MHIMFREIHVLMTLYNILVLQYLSTVVTYSVVQYSSFYALSVSLSFSLCVYVCCLWTLVVQ